CGGRGGGEGCPGLRRNRGARKGATVRDRGGIYHNAAKPPGRPAPDVLRECPGPPAVICGSLGAAAAAGIVCLTGVTEPGKRFDLDIGGLNRTLVLDNSAVFGTVNANRRHYELAAQALARADKSLLPRLITRRVPLERWSEALEHRRGGIKGIIEF